MGFDASMNNADAFFVHAINQGFDALECGPSKKKSRKCLECYPATAG